MNAEGEAGGSAGGPAGGASGGAAGDVAGDAAVATSGAGESVMTGRWLHGIVVLGLFGAVAVSVSSVVTPVVLWVLFLYLVWPRLGYPLYARLAVGASGLMALWLLKVTGFLLAPFILALILAYVFDPVVDRIERRMPRSAAIGLVALPVLGLLVLGAFVIVPAVARQFSQLIANVPDYLETMFDWAGRARAWLIGLQLEGVTDETLPEIGDIDAQEVVAYLRERQAAITENAMSAVLGLGRGLGAVLSLLGYLVLVPIIAYYLLRDWDRLRARILELVPGHSREDVRRFSAEYDRLLNRYLRGQLILAAIVGLIVGVGFWIVGFPYALLLGLIAGVLNIVPYLGFAVSLVVALVIALFSGAVAVSLLKVAGVYAVESVLENILAPRIVGDSVGLHPVWVILALLLFGFFFGFVGLLIAVPATVLIKLGLEIMVRRYRDSAWYHEGRLPGERQAPGPARGDGS